ncbi:hypothetical protein [Streptomyces sp. UG1]|uniref:hypothetical protein n=1 Tax=Streptomyces sp. UG1 TaxID=3417652 RepID=UPI003CE73195
MRTFVEAATGFPTFFFTVALVVVAGATGSDCYDENVDADAWGLGALGPGEVGCGSAAPRKGRGAVLTCGYRRAGATSHDGPTDDRRPIAALPAERLAAVAAWCATRLLVRPLHRLFPDERGPSRTTA